MSYLKKNIIAAFVLVELSGVLGCTIDNNSNDSTSSVNDQSKQVFQTGFVYADNNFDGARLNDFIRINDSTYKALISPENIPINNSPWFGFRLWSKKEINITLEIGYLSDFKNRYIPKLSNDGTLWEPIDHVDLEIDSVRGVAKLNLLLSSDTVWVSSQENLNSKYINDWIDELAKEDYAEKIEIGASVLGRPINLLKLGDDNAKNILMLIGRQHPPEVPGGTISLLAFVKSILSDSELAINFREHYEVIVFPLLNPDGVDNGHWRHNVNGKDLNRDWVTFSQPETRAVRDWVERSKKDNPDKNFRFGIDFHTSYSGPYMLTLDTIPHKIKPVITSQWTTRIRNNTNYELDIRPRPQSLPYCYNWLINEIGIEAITFEEGDEISREIVKRRAEEYADALMEVLTENLN